MLVWKSSLNWMINHVWVPDPFLLPHMQVDKGAIGFVLSGANIMCPGLTSPGARMTKVDKDSIVVSFLTGSIVHCESVFSL